MKKRSMRRFTALLVSGALASKMLGFVREVSMAHVLGASMAADSFRGAMASVLIPLAFLRNESVLAIMIPMQRDAIARDDAPRQLGSMVVALTSMALAIMLGTEALGKLWVNTVVGGFSQSSKILTLDFVRIMALAMPASALLDVLSAGEIALGRARLTNLRASLLNVAILTGIAFLAVTGNVDILAWSFTIAFNFLGTLALFTLWREGIVVFDGLTLKSVIAVSRDFFHRLRPLFALPLAEQGNLLVERLLASRLTSGAVASLDYARALTESALLLISQPVGLAVLSSHTSENTNEKVQAIARPVLALGLPASVFLIIFATDIVKLVYFRGAFDAEALFLTSQALSGIAYGLWAATLAWILIRILNGTGRNALAALIIVSAYIVNISVNLITSKLLLSNGNGMLLLGLGETTRSAVLLIGVISVLDCRRKILMLILLALGPSLLMGLVGWYIQAAFSGALERLALGIGTYLACTLLATALLMPGLYIALIKRVQVSS